MTRNEFIQQWMLNAMPRDVNREMANVTAAIEELEHQFSNSFFQPTRSLVEGQVDVDVLS